MGRGRGRAHRAIQATKFSRPSTVEHVELPIQVTIRGVPVSLQGDSARKAEWQAYVSDELRHHANVIGRVYLPRSVSLKVSLRYYYAGWSTDLDIDNFVKPMLDAGNKVVWDDDAQILDLHVAKRSIQRETDVEVSDPEFAKAFSAGGDFVQMIIEKSSAQEF